MTMNDNMFEPLDAYEEELINSIENDEWASVPMSEKNQLDIKDMAKKTLERLDSSHKKMDARL